MVYIMTFAPSRSTRRRRDRPQYGVALVADRAPEPGSPARNHHGHLIEMPPRRERLRCETAQKNPNQVPQNVRKTRSSA